MILILVVFFAVAFRIRYDSRKAEEWDAKKQILTVTVTEDIKIDYYGFKYKPAWMDLRDYRRDIMELNNMDAPTLYKGQILKLYVLTNAENAL